MENRSFTTKEEIDRWYERSIDDLVMCVRTEVYNKGIIDNTCDYSMILIGINRIKSRLYDSLNLNEELQSVKFERLIKERF